MRSPRQDRNAQSAMVDAVMFMAIMLIASAVILGYNDSGDYAECERAAIQRYAQDFSVTFLAMETGNPGAANESSASGHATASDETVCQALCDEWLFMQNGTSVEDFSASEEKLLDMGKSILRPGLEFAVSCDSGAIFMSSNQVSLESLPLDRAASRISISLDGAAFDIIVYVWVV